MKRRPQTAARGSRWSAWAGALGRRHRRRDERVEGLAFELARPRALARAVQHRWIVSSRLVQPRIHLAIQPVLRGAFWERESLSLREVERTERTEKTAGAERTFKTERIVKTARTQGEPGERFREIERTFSARPSPRAALQRIFERLREPGRALGRPVERAAEAPALARSLAARGRREERPLPGGPPARVLRESPASAPGERRAPSSARGADPREPWATQAPGWGNLGVEMKGFAMPAPAPIDVAALTDQVMRQIDRRVGAWRERTGGF
jgi:hypothetical protein